MDGERSISSGAKGDAESTISTLDMEEEKNGTLTYGRSGRKSEPGTKMSGMEGWRQDPPLQTTIKGLIPAARVIRG